MGLIDDMRSRFDEIEATGMEPMSVHATSWGPVSVMVPAAQLVAWIEATGREADARGQTTAGVSMVTVDCGGVSYVSRVQRTRPIDDPIGVLRGDG
jgi:hypothetical protein